MKKLLALALVVFGLAACQTEPEGLDVQMGGEQEVMLTVSLPETTRANSANGFDLSSLNSTNYTLRYILEVYRVDNNGVMYGSCQRFVETSDGTSMVFPVRLAQGYNYRIVAWTDIVEKNAADPKADRYYYTEEGLDNVVIKDNGTVNWNAMDETRDAYTYVKVVDNFSSSSNLDMTLTRPFAKVRVVATDIDDIRKVGLEPTSAVAEYSQNMYVKYNAVEDKCIADGAKKKEHEYTYTTTASKYEVDDNDGELTLFTDYIFVPESGTAKFSLDVYADDAKQMLIKNNAFNTEIFVERNKLTTIKGDVLTIGGDVKVEVNGTLEEGKTYTYVDTAEDLQAKINNIPENGNANIKLGGDIDLSKLLGATTLSTRSAEVLPFVIAEGKTLVLDLNGFTISTPLQKGSETNHYYAFENYGTLTIKDSSEGKTGEIIARGNFNYGTMTLESGTINACDGNGGYGVRNYAGSFTMNGGSIITSLEDDNKVDNGGYDATTLRIDEGATATINGGTINNICDYTFAIENHGTTTVKGGTITSVHSTVSTYGTMTINGGTFTCNGINGITAHALVAWDGSETTINGGIFDGKDNYNGFNVDADEGAIVNINGGKFLPVHSGSLYGEGTINVMGGEFFDQIAESRIANGYALVEGENGKWTVAKKSVAKIGDTIYYDLSEALAAAKAGDTVTMMNDVTLSEECSLPAGITFNGNGKQINGSIYAGGNITFAGHTKVTAFSASYYNRTITIAEGACLEVTGTGRVTLGYGNTFNITGSVEDAKTADKANIQPSLIIPGGISITGGNDATMNVTNAYVKIGSTSSKNNAANGTFTLNFENSITEFTNQLTFAEPTEGKNPTFNVNIKNSVLTTGTKLILAAPNCMMNVDNSTINISTYFGNSGIVTLTNGSELTGSCIQDNEGINHRGRTIVDNSTFTINATSTGHAFNGRNEGSITAENKSHVTITYYKGITITTDATSTFTGVDVDANKKIYYVSDEMALEPTNPDALNAKVVSNVWDKTTGKGVITFDANLTTIGEKAFQCVTNATPSNWATSITLPESVTTIGDYAFAQCYSLTTINIPDSVTSIGQYAFQSCNAVTTVTIGSGVKSIGSGAFYNCYEIKEIICKSTTAPALADKWVFNGVDKTATVYVPAASVDTYKSANIWSNFTNIVGK